MAQRLWPKSERLREYKRQGKENSLEAKTLRKEIEVIAQQREELRELSWVLRFKRK